MSYFRPFLGAALAAAAIASIAPPARADAGVVWTVTAEVITPNGTIAGGWVTPVGTSGPPVSPGANVPFKSKHSASATGGISGDSFVVTMYCSLDYESITSGNPPSSVSATTGVDYKSPSSTDDPTTDGSDHFDGLGKWLNTRYQDVTLAKTLFLSSPPNVTPQPMYASDAQTSLSVQGGTLTGPSPVHDYKAFTVSPASGNP